VGELAAGADAELGEHLAQVVGDGGRADEQLRGDLRVGEASISAGSLTYSMTQVITAAA
jgi:hypothetical protein